METKRYTAKKILGSIGVKRPPTSQKPDDNNVKDDGICDGESSEDEDLSDGICSFKITLITVILDAIMFGFNMGK